MFGDVNDGIVDNFLYGIDIYCKYKFMNRSFSKIRHIQEANQRLEKRLMSEQVQTTVTQTGKNPGMKTTVNPPMSRAIPEIPGDTPTITNPFKDQNLLNKFVGKQFQTYYENSSSPNGVGSTYKIFEIYKVTPKINVDNRLIFDLGEGQEAQYSCGNLQGDIIFIRDLEIKDGVESLKTFGDFYKAPSLTKELKQTFCTVGSGGKLVPKVDYPTP
jgi:hypothetical protein